MTRLERDGEPYRTVRGTLRFAAFDDVVSGAAAASVDGWDFGWLAGRVHEYRPTWHYFDRVRATSADAMIELRAGVGTMTGNVPRLPKLAVATEGYAPSVWPWLRLDFKRPAPTLSSRRRPREAPAADRRRRG